VSGQPHVSFTPGTHTHCIGGGWVGPRAGLDDVEKRKFLTLQGLKLRPLGRLAHIASRYTDYAIPALYSQLSSVQFYVSHWLWCSLTVDTRLLF
jgi:hypothetical protein